MKRNTENAFTLIELLVVIAIISILAAVLFPVFATAREKARETTCSSNLKQIGLATMQYIQDYDEVYPSGTEFGQQYADHGCGWATQLYAYVKSQQAFLCPNDVKGSYLSYIGNSNIFGTKTIGKQSSPAQSVLISEVHNFTHNFVNDTYMYDQSPTTNGLDYEFYGGNAQNYWGASFVKMETGWLAGYTTMIRAQEGCHLSGSNYMMADGHVKWLLGTRVSGGYNASSTTANQVNGSSTTNGYAAGTENPNYAVTYSSI